MKHGSWTLGRLDFCLGLVMAGAAWAAQEVAPTVLSVDFHGLVQTPGVVASELARIRVGESLNPAELDEAVARLLRSRRFLTAKYVLSHEAGGVRVVFEVRERTTISDIRFQGNSKFRDGQLKDAAGLKIGDAADGFALRQAKDAMIAKYSEAGFSGVSVEHDQAVLDQTGELLFTIREGSRVRIKSIVFEGNSAFTNAELKKQIETKTAIWIFRPGAFDAAQAETDVGRLRSFYRDEGFLDAQVGYRCETGADPQSLNVTFTVEEGTRYRIETLRFRGQAVVSEDELRSILKSREGGTVRQADLDADVRGIQTRYGEQGFIHATVRSIRVFSDTPGLVAVTLQINEGEQFRVGRVVVRGNTRTKDKVVRRALNLYPPDDLFNLTEAREAEQRLVESRVFRTARVTPTGDEPGVRDAVVDVVEADRMGDLLFGLGVTSNSGVIGSVVLDLQNFDILDRPRSWSELLRFKSLTGAGQRLRMELQPGTEVNRFTIDFTEPYFLDRAIRLDTGFYLYQRDRDGYEEGRLGSTVSFGRRFERGALRGWTGEAAFRVENAEVDDVDLLASNEIREDEGSNFMTSIKGTLVRDRTDNRLVPTTGDRFRVAYEQFGAMGGDHFFGRLTSSYTWYRTLYTDPKERKHVLRLEAEGGYIFGDAPVFERFYAGGVGSIRGFEYRGVGPRDGLDRNNVGGDSLILLSGEYSFPLYTDLLRGFVFIDSGTVESGTYRAAVGTGLRLTITLLNQPLPLEFALGFPFVEDDEDDEQVFSFVVGRAF